MPTTRPKYGMIADQLLRDISNGHLPIGAFLPTESELMRSYGVSRHTVRAAVQDLKSRGVVSSQQGQGSKVISDGEPAGYVETIQSIDELITFGHETRRVLLEQQTVEADPALAEMFGCAPGRRFAQVRMLRQTALPDKRTVALVTFWLDILLEPAIADFANVRKSAAEIVRDRFGYDINSVVQTISADRLSAADAATLGAQPGDPALVVTRTYSTGSDAVPYLIAHSLCKAGEFQIVSKFTSKG